MVKNLRAKLTIQKMVANGGTPHSLAQAMREAGYSESYARNPQKIKKTKLWQEYLEEYISDAQILTAHHALLEAQNLNSMDFPTSLSDNDIENIFASSGRKILLKERTETKVKITFAEPDFTVRATALDLAYKLKGLYTSHH